MERTRWTDERLDERFAAIDQTFERIFDELALIRAEIASLRSDIATLQDRMIQIGFGMVGVLAAALFASLTALIVSLA